MEKYENIRRTSDVRGYRIEANAITIEFVNGEKYLYNYTSAGQRHVETMKLLARAGWGLGSYVEDIAKEGYARQLV